MKIVHICLGCFFPDGYSYQENMLPKFHKRLGFDVEVIASLVSFDENGKSFFLEKGSCYTNEYGILVTRLNYKKPVVLFRKFKRYINTYEVLKKARPDILFIHGCQFMDIDIVVKYLKSHKNVKVYVDNHADFSNSATNFLSKYILHRKVWRHFAHLINPFVTKFYGVLPARVDFLINTYGLPKEKVALLVMGADDEEIQKVESDNSRNIIRKKYNISQDDFLIMTGGKIDKWKTQTLLLMKAIKNIQKKNVKLIVFGSITPELKNEVSAITDNIKIQYIGWLKSEDTYQYWIAADLAVFPGRHSVFWEQVAGMGIPMVCKYWSGTTHVDVGGNVEFIMEDNTEEIQKIIEKIINTPGLYARMKQIAQSNGKKQFSYNEIAKRALELK